MSSIDVNMRMKKWEVGDLTLNSCDPEFVTLNSDPEFCARFHESEKMGNGRPDPEFRKLYWGL
jgi:hypothetical protein